MNLYEWGAIQAFKRGERGPLKKHWNTLQGKPLSPELYAFIHDHFIEGKPLRGRKRPTNTIKTAIIQTAYIVAKMLDPSAKEISIHAELAGRFEVSTQRIEQIIYSMPKNPLDSSGKPPAPTRRSPR